MKVFVTGAAGFIGSHMLVQLLRDGHDVLAFDNYSNSSPEALRQVKRLAQLDFSIIEGDVRDRAALDHAMATFAPEAVIHFAGLKAVAESAQRPLAYYDTNVSGSVALLAAMEKVGCNKIVFSSSATVYDARHPAPYSEEHPLAPINPYGKTKRVVEGLVEDWCAAQSGASAAILRYFNPVGAHASGDIGEDPVGVPSNLMPYISQVASGVLEQLQVFGNDYDTQDGTGARDYIHVEDLASAHLSALEYLNSALGCDIFNVGTGQSTTVLQMLTAFEDTVGRPIAYQIAPRRAGDVGISVADVTKARDILGWQSQYDIEDMCRSVWAWQMKHPNGYTSST